MIIPIMQCFDDRYAAPAAVAFLSMLEHADPAHTYALHILHEDISLKHQEMLREVVSRFPNATLQFQSPNHPILRQFAAMETQGHYSKEVLYKLLVSDLFPQYARMMVTDVDVVWCDDVSRVFVDFTSDNEHWLAGIGYQGAEPTSAWSERCFENCYREGFSEEERLWLRQGVGGGYLICNLNLMRRERVAERLLRVFEDNAPRLKQAEQDVINLTCHGHLLRLPIRNMVTNLLYEHLTDEERLRWSDTLSHPVQLHYITDVKPWNSPGCAQAHLWWQTLCRTPFYYEVASRFSGAERRSTFGVAGLSLVKAWHTGDVSRLRLLNHVSLKRLR